MSGRPFERHLNKQVLIEGPENPSVNSEIFGSAIEDNVSGVKSPLRELNCWACVALGSASPSMRDLLRQIADRRLGASCGPHARSSIRPPKDGK